ncbi:NAD-dependent epimerase/dehydratase family protein [Geodermatophilus sp. SYSU D00815]
MRVAVLGAGGFVGGAVAQTLREAGEDVRPVAAPRLTGTSAGPADVAAVAAGEMGDRLVAALTGCEVVVNCAGIANAAAGASPELTGANALLPGVLALAAERAGVRRLVHVSSAAVQGRSRMLDESDRFAPFSPYSVSKAAGEQLLLRLEPEVAGLEVVRYRPTSVHGPDRQVSRALSRLARSRLASVAAPGAQPTPQVLVGEVAAAVRLLVGHARPIGGVYLHPAGAMTTGRLLTLLALGRRPRRIPAALARAVVRLTAVGGMAKAVALSRRLELVWFGQSQKCGRLADLGFAGFARDEDWTRLAEQLAQPQYIGIENTEQAERQEQCA